MKSLEADPTSLHPSKWGDHAKLSFMIGRIKFIHCEKSSKKTRCS